MVCLHDIEGEQAVMCQLQSERQVRGVKRRGKGASTRLGGGKGGGRAGGGGRANYGPSCFSSTAKGGIDQLHAGHNLEFASKPKRHSLKE